MDDNGLEYNVTFHKAEDDSVNGGGRQFSFELTTNVTIESVAMKYLPTVLTELTKKGYVIDKIIPTMRANWQ